MAADRSATARSSSPLANQPLARLKCAFARLRPRASPDSMIAVQAVIPASGATSLLAQSGHSAASRATAGGAARTAAACAASPAKTARLVRLYPLEPIERLCVSRIDRERLLEIRRRLVALAELLVQQAAPAP